MSKRNTGRKPIKIRLTTILILMIILIVIAVVTIMIALRPRIESDNGANSTSTPVSEAKGEKSNENVIYLENKIRTEITVIDVDEVLNNL